MSRYAHNQNSQEHIMIRYYNTTRGTVGLAKREALTRLFIEESGGGLNVDSVMDAMAMEQRFNQGEPVTVNGETIQLEEK